MGSIEKFNKLDYLDYTEVFIDAMENWYILDPNAATC